MTARPVDVEAAPFFVLRTALLPVGEWLAFAEGMTAPSAAAGGEEAALAADREQARARLRALVERPDVREALFIASPSLDEAIDVWMRAPDSERGLKAERSLVRYLARMCGRSTPFGLFAGCALGRVERGAATRLTLASRREYRRHTRLDMDYLFALAEKLAHDPELQERLRYRLNSSLYRAGGRIRYVEARLSGKLRAYHLVAVEPSEYIDATLERARAGAGLGALVAALAQQAEVTPDEAREFVAELVAQQLIVPDLQVPVTGPEPIHALLRRLEGHAAAAPLSAARDALAAIDREPLGVPTARYRDIAATLAALPVEAELSRLFQIDLVTRSPSLTIGPAVVREATRAVDVLHRLAVAGDSLRSFREAFAARYESAEVPLVEVLDEECGIGFNRSQAPSAEASPLIEGLVFPPARGEAEVRWGARQQLLLGKLMQAAASGVREIRLDDDDVAALGGGGERPSLPDSFAVMAALVAESAAAVDEGRFALHVNVATGPSGANLLGRFCHGDAELERLVREELRVEEQRRPDAIFAEIVHLPEGRVGNVLLRPLLRGHELAFLGVSGAPPEQQITVDDLTLAVEGNRVVMRSRRLGREVIPRLTTAHNYTSPGSLGIYKFLCMLQAQGVASGMSWSWAPFEAAPFLPRVVCGAAVLAPARWRLDRAQLEALAAGKGVDRWRAVQALRRTLSLPRFVALEEGDNRLPIDFDHVLSVDNFVHLVKERPEAVLMELPALDGGALPVDGPEGRFVHELVLPFRRRATAATATTATTLPTATTATEAAPPIARRLPPGSEWLYWKLYAGAASIDRILRDVVAPHLHDARAAGAVDDWFFIRYGDPDWHLRLRFHGDPSRLAADVEPALRRAVQGLLDDGLVWRAQVDTYHREVERYGGAAGMRACEQLFAADSDAVLAILAELDGDAGHAARWRLCLRGMDALLGDLGFDLDGKYAVVKQLRASFGQEHAVDVHFEKQLGDRFRRERAALEALLADPFDPAHELAPGFAILAERSARQAPIGAALQAAARAGELAVALPALAGSLVHMHANRIFRGAARANELVLYDFLTRLYEGRRARRKKAP